MRFLLLLVSSALFASDIAIVDFGSQTTHLIAQRLKRMGVDAQIVSPEEALDACTTAKGIILSGGPASVYSRGAPTIDREVFSKDLPILGICYGWQLMAHLLGGRVESGMKEYGIESVKFNKSAFFLPVHEFPAVVSHGDTVKEVPQGFEIVGSTDSVYVALAIDWKNKRIGVQFHPEVKHTSYGNDLLLYFAEHLCGLTGRYVPLDPQEIVAEIQHRVGCEEEVVCAVSGGVDSTVASFLIAKAIGKRMHPIYVDTGLMRPGTREKVEDIFTRFVDADLHIVEANERFMRALEGIEDPEAKRKAIGKLYVDIFEEEAEKLGGVKFLAQGTIYSDVIESKGSALADKIKSHHNVGGLPEALKFELLEPLRKFYKDEVRDLGSLAGLPKQYIDVHPFPGPGYAVRIRGEVSEDRLSRLRQADAIVIEELCKANLYEQVFQCFAVMTGAYSTAVKGDGRAFEEVVAIRAYESSDVMTASWAKLPYTVLENMARRIVNEVPRISRVVYDITGKPPATMEWE